MALQRLPSETLALLAECLGDADILSLLVSQRICTRWRDAAQRYLASLGRPRRHSGRSNDAAARPGSDGGGAGSSDVDEDGDDKDDEDEDEDDSLHPHGVASGSKIEKFALPDLIQDHPGLRARFGAVFRGARRPGFGKAPDRDSDDMFTSHICWTKTPESRAPYLRPGASWRRLPVVVPDTLMSGGGARGGRVRRVQAVTLLAGRHNLRDVWFWSGWGAENGGGARRQGQTAATAVAGAGLTLGQLWDLVLAEQLNCEGSRYRSHWRVRLGRSMDLKRLRVPGNFLGDVASLEDDLLEGLWVEDPESAVLCVSASVARCGMGLPARQFEDTDPWSPDPMEEPLHMAKGFSVFEDGECRNWSNEGEDS